MPPPFNGRKLKSGITGYDTIFLRKIGVRPLTYESFRRPKMNESARIRACLDLLEVRNDMGLARRRRESRHGT